MPIFHEHRLRTGRVSEHGRVYLITTITYGRERVFANWQTGRLVVREMVREEQRGYARSIAWVVMPDHLHWLVELTAGDLSQMVCRVKARSAAAVNTATGRKGSLWRKGFHDKAVRRDENLKHLARYVVANPVRAGLVRSVRDYALWDAVWL
ncbi:MULTISPECIES: REP-associated tyrosine transposase [Pseudomonas]|uniref:Transposase n=1 Tax=Pseudomonas eucalypticola TaxID=2599595 RepID=A0A7D5H9Q4_9PSED|nr:MULTISPECIES: transposase [Pseudomonas]QKZ07763.1 transposase [Pseudomonas eucalypticola]